MAEAICDAHSIVNFSDGMYFGRKRLCIHSTSFIFGDGTVRQNKTAVVSLSHMKSWKYTTHSMSEIVNSVCSRSHCSKMFAGITFFISSLAIMKSITVATGYFVRSGLMNGERLLMSSG